MKQLKLFTIIGILFVVVTGSFAHFLYDWTGNNFIIGLFTPINESIWEHMKLLFFPMLIYSFPAAYKLKSDYPCIAPALCLGNIIGTFLIPVFFYTYTCIFNKDIFILDIGTFILSTIIAFYITYKFALSCKLKSYAVILYGIIIILFLCFMIFTVCPPDLKIFADPASSSNG